MTTTLKLRISSNLARQLVGQIASFSRCQRFFRSTASSESVSDPQSDNDSQEDRERQIKQRILRSSMPFVLKYGWSKKALAEGAVVEGLPGMAHGLFPRGGVELIYHFYTDCNERLSQQLTEEAQQKEKEQEQQQTDDSTTESSSPKVRPLIRHAVESRLRMNIPYLEKWPQAMGMLALPQNVPEALTNVMNLADEIWYHAGDRSTDFNWYTKRLLLVGVYKATEVFMVQDSSDDFNKTWNFLDNRINELSKVGKFVRKAIPT